MSSWSVIQWCREAANSFTMSFPAMSWPEQYHIVSLYPSVRNVMNCQHWYFYVHNLSSVCLFIFHSEEDISVKQAQSHQLARLLAQQLPSRANLSWTLLKCCRFCILFCRCVYLHWWRSLMPSVCNLLSACALLSQWQNLMPSGCNMP